MELVTGNWRGHDLNKYLTVFHIVNKFIRELYYWFKSLN